MTAGLIVDLFAGGGGASQGIEAALGRPVDIALNHDPVALAVHKANHPKTRHLEADIWKVKPEEATGGRRVAILWASPDCTHFSVAKGGKPRQKKIRSLAWAVVRWAKATKPAVIFLENVTEFQGWGPLRKDGRPDKRFMGVTFRKWRSQLERLGYVVDYRVLDASLYGAPTKRRRLFLIARCDGEPIIWPEITHGKGKLPVHTAAECMDWSLACPSIFERKRPLADKTLWRIAQGLKRFVFDNPHPFIVGVGGRAGQSGPTGMQDPVGTITAKNDRALVTPYLSKFQENGRGVDLREPLHTVLAGAPRFGLVTPYLVETNHGVDEKTGNREHSLEEPLGTVMSGGNGRSLVVPTLIQTGYGERKGQAARVLDIEEPLGTVVAGGQKHAVVAAFLAKHFGGVVGQRVDQPASTITATDHHGLATAHLVKLKGKNLGQQLTLPLQTVTSGGLHFGEVRAFLTAYNQSDYAGGFGQALREPMRTVTTKHRLGLVTVHGVDYEVADIGLRMLKPHELLRAQFGRFAVGYDLSKAIGKKGKPTDGAKVRLIGNSVCPEVAEAIVAANARQPLERVA